MAPARDADGATRVYTADDLGLSAVTPHPKQGYHLKVSVDSREAPGGAKQKVLWLAPCEQQPQVATDVAATTATDVAATTASGESGSGGALAAAGAVTALAPATAASPSTGESATSTGTMAAEHSAPAAGQVLGTSFSRSGSRGTGAQAASALPAVAGAPLTSLAFTGASGVALLLALGLGAVALGVALRVAARRRAVVRA